MKYHRNYSRWRKGEVVHEDEQLHCLGLMFRNSASYSKRARPRIILGFLVFLYFSLLMMPQHFTSTFSLIYFGVEDGRFFFGADANVSLCEFVANGTICCDRSSNRTDICIMKGDVRTDSATSSVFLFKGNDSVEYEDNEVLQHEKIRPYTRKWEPNVMDTVTELNLIAVKGNAGFSHQCDVHHDVPAVFFSTEGYTGNLFHEFNDGIIPLYITSQHLNKKVVFVNLDYHLWWLMKYGDIVSELSDYPLVDFSGDNRTHCFHKAIVGLRIHGDLMINSLKMEDNRTIGDFRKLLDQAYSPRINGLIQEEEHEARKKDNLSAMTLALKSKEEHYLKRPKLVIIARNGSREITNQDSLIKLAERIGFSVEIVMPVRTSELAKIYRILNATDVMIGVHGAALTHLIYLNPGSVFIQIIPLGTDWAAETYFAAPAPGFGIKYIGYKIMPNESSLYDQYDRNDLILKDPWKVNERGWQITKEIYLEHQNVRLNLERFQRELLRAYYFVTTKRRRRQFPF